MTDMTVASHDAGEDTATLLKSRARSVWMTQFTVIHALILHDIKSRYFGNGWGYVVMIVWPAAHIAVIMTTFLVTGRAAPFGESRMLYIATGVYPYIIFSYLSRFTMTGALMNRTYLNYPIVKPLDLMLARIILEINTSFLILVGLFIVLALLGAPIVPLEPIRAAIGILAAVTLGIGFGVLGAVFCMIWPLASVVYALVLLTFWLTSGVVINPELLPASIGDLFAWNPVLHCTEMIRSGYYPDYPTRLLSRTYVFSVAFVSFVLGLVLERLLQRQVRG